MLRPEICFFSIHPSLSFHWCWESHRRYSELVLKSSFVCGLSAITEEGTGNCSCIDNHCSDTIYFGPVHKA